MPAVTHVDYSARIQTVDQRHGRLQRLMQRFHARTGCPIVVNTSFNLSWEPIVLTPEQAEQYGPRWVHSLSAAGFVLGGGVTVTFTTALVTTGPNRSNTRAGQIARHPLRRRDHDVPPPRARYQAREGPQ